MKATNEKKAVGYRNVKAVRIFGKGFTRERSEDYNEGGKLHQVYRMTECPEVKVTKVRHVLNEVVTGRKLGIQYEVTVEKNGARPTTFVQSVTTDAAAARSIEAKVKLLAKSRNR